MVTICGVLNFIYDAAEMSAFSVSVHVSRRISFMLMCHCLLTHRRAYEKKIEVNSISSYDWNMQNSCLLSDHSFSLWSLVFAAFIYAKIERIFFLSVAVVVRRWALSFPLTLFTVPVFSCVAYVLKLQMTFAYTHTHYVWMLQRNLVCIRRPIICDNLS